MKCFNKKEDLRLITVSLLLAVAVFGGSYVYNAYAEGVTLSVTVASTLTFAVSHNDWSGSLAPGTAKFATSTLSVTTNNTPGWNVTLSGTDQSPTDTVMDLTTDDSVGITDQVEWIPGAATTTAGNAVRISALDNSADVLAFRAMTASGTAPFRAGTWWGTTDAYTDSATTLWAGIASSTVQRQIGNAGAGSYSASAQLSTVLYYLDVPATQQTGTYTGALVYTATVNP